MSSRPTAKRGLAPSERCRTKRAFHMIAHHSSISRLVQPHPGRALLASLNFELASNLIVCKMYTSWQQSSGFSSTARSLLPNLHRSSFERHKTTSERICTAGQQAILLKRTGLETPQKPSDNQPTAGVLFVACAAQTSPARRNLPQPLKEPS